MLEVEVLLLVELLEELLTELAPAELLLELLLVSGNRASVVAGLDVKVLVTELVDVQLELDELLEFVPAFAEPWLTLEDADPATTDTFDELEEELGAVKSYVHWYAMLEVAPELLIEPADELDEELNAEPDDEALEL